MLAFFLSIPRKDLKPCHAEQVRGASGKGAGRRPSPLSGKKIQLYAGLFFDHTIGGLETLPSPLANIKKKPCT